MSDHCQNLFRGILLRAIRDASLLDENPISEADSLAARNFLLRDKEDFEMIALAAGYDPEWLRDRLKRIL